MSNDNPLGVFGRLAILVVIASLVSLAGAQVGIPYVPPELHQNVRRLHGDTIHFCVWTGLSPTAALDREVIDAVGEALLINVVVHDYAFAGGMEADDFHEQVYIQLGARCDAIGGLVLVNHGFPEWLVPSRPYFEAPFVLLVREDAPYERLGEVPVSATIGSQMYTEGDLQLLNYLGSLPENRRWRRFPYTSIEMLSRHVAAGTVEAGLVWHASWTSLGTKVEVEELGLRTVEASPLPRVSSGVGFGLFIDNDFLRSTIDSALEILEAEGVLEDIAARLGYLHDAR
jgi:polar amino acid transport system substrate-binding protein